MPDLQPAETMVQSSHSASCTRGKWVRRIGGSLALVILLIGGLFCFRAPLLVGLAKAWVVNEPTTKADAIVILGGGPENRPFAAADLFRQGVAPKVLYMNVKPGPAEALGVVPTEAEQTRRILLSNNVPASAMYPLGIDVSSTYQEACAVRAWIKQTGASSIVITTDIFHTRRARWIFHRELSGVPVKIYIVGVKPVRFTIDNWWQNEDGLIFFQNEMVKSVFYWFKY